MGDNHLNSKSDLTRMESLICGANAGLVARFVIAPLDLVKIRLQLHERGKMLPLVSKIAREEGLSAFWKGNAPAELLYVVYSSVQYSTLRFVNHALGELGLRNEQAKQLLAGGVAGSTATFVSYPFDLLRTRGAANISSRSQLLATIRQTYAHSGIGGFYHGCTATVVSVFPYMALFFGTYSYLRDTRLGISSKQGGLTAAFTASSVASIVSKGAVYPLDTIRKRVQVHGLRVQRNSHSAGYGEQYSHNFWLAGKAIYQREGLQGLYRGLPVSLLKAWPGSFVSIMVFEATLTAVRW